MTSVCPDCRRFKVDLSNKVFYNLAYHPHKLLSYTLVLHRTASGFPLVGQRLKGRFIPVLVCLVHPDHELSPS